MPFVPHTQADIDAMLGAIGVDSIDELFDEIPRVLRHGELSGVAAGRSEMEVARLMRERAEQDGHYVNFIGAGAYEHHIPAAVWEIVTRGEFYSAYTPYQAEASQGTLQVLYEFQSMMASLTGMDVSNASLYDGASALAEAVLMAVRAHKKARRVLLPDTVHPIYRQVVLSIVKNQRIELVSVPFDSAGGHTGADALKVRLRSRWSIQSRWRCSSRPASGVNGVQISPSARDSLSGRRLLRAAPTSVSCVASKRMCGRCPGASSGVRSMRKANRASL
jgi:glycine dehydrogenase subunit 1